MKVLLPPNHPYVQKFHVGIAEWRTGQIFVRWRDITTTKQEREFNTRAEAEEFSKRLHKTRRVIDSKLYEDICETLESVTEFWR